MELTNVEKLAIAQGFQKAVGEMVKTKTPTNLRGIVDAQMADNYRLFGAKSFDVNLLGEKVGTYSLTVSKPTESKIKTVLEVVDKEEFMAWAFAHGFVKVDQCAVDMHFAATGEVPDGCEPEEVVVPGEVGGEVVRTTLKVEPELVMKALGNRLEEATTMLLEGGEQ